MKQVFQPVLYRGSKICFNWKAGAKDRLWHYPGESVVTAEIDTVKAEILRLQQQLQTLQKEKPDDQNPKAGGDLPPLDNDTRRKHRALRTSNIRYALGLPVAVHVSGPFVYGMILPLSFLHLFLVIYNAVCFPLWGLERIDRKPYFVIDRHHLSYLNAIEKLNCVYCGYANGVIAFARELAAQTEFFWCPIKHRARLPHSHSRYAEFIEYGDAEAWKNHPSRKVERK